MTALDDNDNSKSAETMNVNLHATRPACDTQELARKTIEDINFLQSRIEKIKTLSSPNASILKTYESMLKARQSVLEWLIKQGAEIAPGIIGDDQKETKKTG